MKQWVTRSEQTAGLYADWRGTAAQDFDALPRLSRSLLAGGYLFSTSEPGTMSVQKAASS